MFNQTELIHENEWDILVVLDACRFDTFEKYYGRYLKGRLWKVESPAWKTPDWVVETFPLDQKFPIIYCSGNPHITQRLQSNRKFHIGQQFLDVEDVWFYGWDDIIKTVPAMAVNEAVNEAMEHGSQVIAHYMQPHTPFIGSMQQPTQFARSKSGDRLARGPYRPEEYQRNYEYNLLYVLPYVRLLYEMHPDNRVVVTSDHGEEYVEAHMGHTRGVPEVLEVPWLVLSDE